MIDGTWFRNISWNTIQETTVGQPIPDRLYHYTSSEGLKGIIESNCIRFADAMFMNDGSETVHGMYLFAQILTDFMADKPDDEKSLAEELKQELAVTANIMRPIIFCMSAEQNLLNQWRDYGADVVPYSIEFDTYVLQRSNEFTFPVYLAKVIYEIHYQQHLLLKLIAAIYQRAKDIPAGLEISQELKSQLLKAVAIEILWLLYRFKNPAFAAEQEWRLISHGDSVAYYTQPRFRTSRLGVIPFYEFRATKSLTLPIRSVLVGPSPYSNMSNMALQQFLAAHGYGGVATNYSTIPIRR
ncbi:MULTISPECIES: DUF2971 domain-containing protein [Rhizobium]|uniref:DUF2971 domain-containing protein n=1 Tax=Rhizobium brockwellii TaxID=3019932 RepID=A0ABU3YNP8_9HYPH|nr:MULTISPECIES: DUF2971 domain-containing protein [Rhizobium]MDV4181067.1 DUF2971 domain-containing protein [Rhizobium brockwellii]MDV4187460.1 DUF2971 domain-containing protein [Rhizobium brockwellii]TBC92690.1 DUF2971 domain-containing protein [Rhizobium leguminosarum]TBY81065.1 DUF2971 domain-containing protein [Rhizobium leguminosarum bv. viciae]TCA53737.1 DUF2971 domain-containing protein [Rhizobium leguminosarum bv. viciae]